MNALKAFVIMVALSAITLAQLKEVSDGVWALEVEGKKSVKVKLRFEHEWTFVAYTEELCDGKPHWLFQVIKDFPEDMPCLREGEPRCLKAFTGSSPLARPKEWVVVMRGGEWYWCDGWKKGGYAELHADVALPKVKPLYLVVSAAEVGGWSEYSQAFYDAYLVIKVYDISGSEPATVKEVYLGDDNPGWLEVKLDLSKYAGHKVRISIGPKAGGHVQACAGCTGTWDGEDVGIDYVEIVDGKGRKVFFEGFSLERHSPPPAAGGGLVARYSFDGCSLKDFSGNGHHLRVLKGEFACVPGPRGEAAWFDGSTALASEDFSWSSDSFTIVYLVRFDKPYEGWLVTLVRGKDSSDFADPGEHGFALQFHVRDYDSAEIEAVPHLRLTGYDSYFARDLGVTLKFRRGAWTFVAATYDGSNFALYVNGVKVYEGYVGKVTLSKEPMPLLLGYDPQGLTEYLIGALDEVMVYDRALSEGEVEALYRALLFGGAPQAPPRPSPVVALITGTVTIIPWKPVTVTVVSR